MNNYYAEFLIAYSAVLALVSMSMMLTGQRDWWIMSISAAWMLIIGGRSGTAEIPTRVRTV